MRVIQPSLATFSIAWAIVLLGSALAYFIGGGRIIEWCAKTIWSVGILYQLMLGIRHLLNRNLEKAR